MPAKPSIVFAHGLWADGSCFSKVRSPLQAEGFEVIASQHGLDTHAGDVATRSAHAGAGPQSGHSGRPLVRWKSHYSCGNR